MYDILFENIAPVLMLLGMFFQIGVLPLIMVGVIWLTMTSVYSYKSL